MMGEVRGEERPGSEPLLTLAQLSPTPPCAYPVSCLFTGIWLMKRSRWKLKAMTLQGWDLEGMGMGIKSLPLN